MLTVRFLPDADGNRPEELTLNDPFAFRKPAAAGLRVETRTAEYPTYLHHRMERATEFAHGQTPRWRDSRHGEPG
jgi:hypothetical protein